MMHALLAVEEIVTDLSDRRGLCSEWDQIDEEIKAEIFEKWRGIVDARIAEAVAEAVAGEREALAQLIDRVGKMFAETQLEVSAAIRARGGK